MASLVVEAATPHKVLSASAELLRSFALEEAHVVGRTLRVFFGPCTDAQAVFHLIRSACDGPVVGGADSEAAAHAATPARAFAALYSSDCCLRLTALDAKRNADGNCELGMRPSDAVDACEAFASLSEVGTTSKIVLLADTLRIDQVSAGFSERFGFPPAIARGSTCRLMQGPGTDSELLAQWVQTAKSGVSQGGALVAYTHDCTEIPALVTVTPVHDGQGQISHVMLTMMQDDVGEERRAARVAQIQEYLRLLESSLAEFSAGRVVPEDLRQQEKINRTITEFLADVSAEMQHAPAQRSMRERQQTESGSGFDPALGTASIYGNIGKCYLALGAHEEAIHCAAKGQRVAKAAGAVPSVASAHSLGADAYAHGGGQGEAHEAATLRHRQDSDLQPVCLGVEVDAPKIALKAPAEGLAKSHAS